MNIQNQWKVNKDQKDVKHRYQHSKISILIMKFHRNQMNYSKILSLIKKYQSQDIKLCEIFYNLNQSTLHNCIIKTKTISYN